MTNSKLLTLFQHLTTNILKKIELYLQSPFFVEDKKKEIHNKAVKLFLYIKSSNLKIKQLEKKVIFRHIYPNEPFKLIKMNQLMAYLVKQIERFIVFQMENENNYLNNIRYEQKLMTFYAENNLIKWYEAEKRNVNKMQNKTSLQDSAYYLSQFSLECIYAQVASIQNNRKTNISLKTLISSLQNFYHLSLLEIACLIHQSNVFNKEELRLIEEHLLQLQATHDSNIPTLQVFQAALELIQQKQNDQLYFRYKSLLMTHHACFPPKDVRGLFTYALNYCILQLNINRKEFIEECWNLYCLGLENNILYIDKKIMPADLKNIVTLSLRLQKYDWAEKFLYQHKKKINANHANEVYSFNLANVFFYQQKYTKVHQILRTLKCNDMFYDLAMRRLEIKVLYEQNEIEVLYAKLNAYRVFLHRNNIIDSVSKEMNINFVNSLYKLLKVFPSNQKQLTILSETLSKVVKLAERKWLIAKLDTL